MNRRPAVPLETAWTVVLGAAAIVLVQLLLLSKPIGPWGGDILESCFWFDLKRSELLQPSPPTFMAAPPFTAETAWRQARPFAWPLVGTAVLLLVSIGRALRGRGKTRGPWRAGLLCLLVAVAGAAWAQFDEYFTLSRITMPHWVDSDRASTPWGAPVLLLSGLALAALGVLSTALLHLLRRPGERP